MEAPEVNQGLDIYWEAFIDLSTCRGGMGDGPIPWDRAMQYADRLTMDDEEWEDFWFIVSRLDETWLDYQDKKRKTKGG
jgi:hypothetical protein